VATIRLENLVKTFKPSGMMFRHAALDNTTARMQDRAYRERVAAQRQIQDSKVSVPVRALDGVSLTIENGETMAIVGPSGCGKSTLLRVVAGLESLEEGTVCYDDRDMKGVPPKERGIGMVFQNYALYPNMKGEGNLGFFFKVRQRPPEEMLERIRVTSEIMGIGFDVLLERKPGTLSGGQQQRVAIGRCIVRDPSLFLFDEPLSNLDAKLRSSTRIEINRLLHRFKITALYVTHDQTEAITLGDRLAVMRAGKIEQVGPYHEIMENPVNAFVAGFLGLPPMNLLPGWHVMADSTLQSAMGVTRVPRRLVNQVTPDQEVILGFRSDGASIVPESEPLSADQLVIGGEVLNAEPHFAQHLQVVNVQAGGRIFGVQAPIDLRLNTGWRVNVVIREETVYLFDQKSDARILPA
jgi:ABC-type sugar transport system ATPase subunit